MSNNPGSGPNEVFLPFVSKGDSTSGTPGGGTGNAQRIVVDPVTRIEGHLRLEVKLENGAVSDAWSAGTMFRGIELILKGRDPRDAWIFAQRLCGVCTTVHAIASVRAVEKALGVRVPDNARLLRNLLESAQFVHDHVIHFYHLHALDWVDITSALNADPADTSQLAKSRSDWPKSEASDFQNVKDRIQSLINSGQLGLFANGYWGHPAYKLPAEVNLLAVAHYLDALEWQAKFAGFEARLGGKNPHPQTYLVGGMAIPVDPNQVASINASVISNLRSYVQSGMDFVNKVYLPDVLLIASYYPEWTTMGGGYRNFMSYGDFPQDFDDSRSNLWMPAGIIMDGNLTSKPVGLDLDSIQEFVTHSWYSYAAGDQAGLHPTQGQTSPNYSGPTPPYVNLNVDGKYSWLKAPRYDNKPMEVGPLARVLVAYASGHATIKPKVDYVLATLGVGKDALFSTIGRVAARAIETSAIIEQMGGWVTQLEYNMTHNVLEIHNNSKWSPSSWPSDAVGFGLTEAPRGGLGHWVHIQNGQIANYQMVIPTTWNGSPRDHLNQRGVWEQALVGTPMAQADQPLEILRTVHSFDPCMACAVHVVDTTGKELVNISVDNF